jgi:hypothetical protein
MNDNPIDGRPLGPFANLRRRISLTYTHFGLRTLLFRALTLPLRFTPLERRMRLRSHARDQELRSALAWYREHAVLGGAHGAEGHALPRRPRQTGVGVGEEAPPADELEDGERSVPLSGGRALALAQALELRAPVGRERVKPALELEAHGRGGIGARPVGPVHDGHVLGELEAPQDVLEPALVRRL